MKSTATDLLQEHVRMLATDSHKIIITAVTACENILTTFARYEIFTSTLVVTVRRAIQSTLRTHNMKHPRLIDCDEAGA